MAAALVVAAAASDLAGTAGGLEDLIEQAAALALVAGFVVLAAELVPRELARVASAADSRPGRAATRLGPAR